MATSPGNGPSIHRLRASGMHSPSAQYEAPRDSAPLPQSVDAVSAVVSELKARLMSYVKLSGTLEADLDACRKRVEELLGERQETHLALAKMQEAVTITDDYKAELQQVHKERVTLSKKVENLVQALNASGQREKELAQVIDRVRAERNDVGREVSCLESQFARAVRVIEGLRAEVATCKESETEQRRKVRQLTTELQKARGERNTFEEKLEESRLALEEIRKSLLEASLSSRSALSSR